MICYYFEVIEIATMTESEKNPIDELLDLDPLSMGTKKGERPPNAPVGKKNTRYGSVPLPLNLATHEQGHPDA
jgi:hypothetical protein